MKYIDIDRHFTWADIQPNTRRRVSPDSQYDFYLFKTAESEAGFLLDNIKIDKIDEYKFKNITIKYGDTFSIIILKNDSYIDLFAIICADIYNSSQFIESNIDLIKNYKLKISKWIEFFNKKKSIGAREQQGLFAELHVLSALLFHKYGYEDSVSSWVGIDDDVHDFCLPELVLEVKSSLASNSSIVTISSEHQLNANIRLILIHVNLEVSTRGLSVKDLINNIAAFLSQYSMNAYLMFLDKTYSFLALLDSSDDLKKYKPLEIEYYLVDDSFPRISPIMLPRGVSSVNYKLDLKVCVSNIITNF